MRKGPKPRPVAERFWEKVDKAGGPDACWPWTAFCNHERGGYGQFCVSGSLPVGSHIVAWELENRREVPGELQVMHSCNNPPCCNPAHLSVGTPQEDSDYKRACGRHAKGTKIGGAKLTDDDVREIRSLRREGMIQREIADKYGVNRSVISRICSRILWPHVE